MPAARAEPTAPCTVPPVEAGARVGAAKEAIAAAGCSAGPVTSKRSKKVKKGRVVKLRVKAGTELPFGSPVGITKSSGKG